MIINFGFAGAAIEGTGAGDIVIAGRILLHRKSQLQKQPGLLADKGEESAGILEALFRCREFHIRTGTFITMVEIKVKGNSGVAAGRGRKSRP